MMTVWALTLLGASALFAADEQQLALALKAQIDFDRVELAAVPAIEGHFRLRAFAGCGSRR